MKKHKSSKKIICDLTITNYEKKLNKVLRIIEKSLTSENLPCEDLYNITTSLITNDGEMSFESIVKILSLIYEIIPIEKFFYSTESDNILACNKLRIIIQISFSQKILSRYDSEL